MPQKKRRPKTKKGLKWRKVSPKKRVKRSKKRPNTRRLRYPSSDIETEIFVNREQGTALYNSYQDIDVRISVGTPFELIDVLQSLEGEALKSFKSQLRFGKTRKGAFILAFEFDFMFLGGWVSQVTSTPRSKRIYPKEFPSQYKLLIENDIIPKFEDYFSRDKLTGIWLETLRVEVLQKIEKL